MKPSDVLKDGEDYVDEGNVRIRKGSIAAFIANVNIILDAHRSFDEIKEAESDLLSLYPMLVKVGVFDVFQIKSEKIRALCSTTYEALAPVSE